MVVDDTWYGLRVAGRETERCMHSAECPTITHDNKYYMDVFVIVQRCPAMLPEVTVAPDALESEQQARAQTAIITGCENEEHNEAGMQHWSTSPLPQGSNVGHLPCIRGRRHAYSAPQDRGHRAWVSFHEQHLQVLHVMNPFPVQNFTGSRSGLGTLSGVLGLQRASSEPRASRNT